MFVMKIGLMFYKIHAFHVTVLLNVVNVTVLFNVMISLMIFLQMILMSQYHIQT